MIGDALPLTASEEQVAYFRPHETSAFVAGRFPLFITHFADGRLGSGFPLIRDPGIKLMLEHKSATTPSSHRLDALRDHAVRLLPGLSGQVLGSALCRYTLTPDEDFVLDRWPDDPRIVIASPCSGHGFKFGALFGGALAALALGETPKIDLSRFRMDRFAKPAMVRA
jgi:sarcosine oxidase